jgi:hypothetical protein
VNWDEVDVAEEKTPTVEQMTVVGVIPGVLARD